jgi:hypothetical protein
MMLHQPVLPAHQSAEMISSEGWEGNKLRMKGVDQCGPTYDAALVRADSLRQGPSFQSLLLRPKRPLFIGLKAD